VVEPAHDFCVDDGEEDRHLRDFRHSRLERSIISPALDDVVGAEGACVRAADANVLKLSACRTGGIL
jgi:hypothetical protein